MSTDRAGFQAAILADPGDDAPRAAYADWLRETGDPHDEAHGRFIAAGLALHHTRAPEEGNEGPYFDALAAQNETAPAVIGEQAAALLGWPRHGRSERPAWAWDNDAAAPGRLTARLLPPATGAAPRSRASRAARRTPPPAEALVYERGCVAEVRLTLRAWRDRGRGLLERCPLTRLWVIDVPGLWVAFERVGPDRWRARGRLQLPGEPRRLRPRPRPPAPPEFTPGTPPRAFEDQWPAVGRELVTRAQLCQSAFGLVWWLVEHIAHTAGFAWPGPPADDLYAALFDGQDDVIEGLGGGTVPDADGLDPEDQAALDDMLDSPSYD